MVTNRDRKHTSVRSGIKKRTGLITVLIAGFAYCSVQACMPGVGLYRFEGDRGVECGGDARRGGGVCVGGGMNC